MKLLFAKSNWEAVQLPLPRFIERAAQARFGATEIHLHGRTESAAEIVRWHEHAGLKLIAQIATAGRTPAEHLDSLEARYVQALECRPIAVNAHTGSDLFTPEDNRRLFARGVELAAEHGMPLWHETHRRRALYRGPDTAAYLREVSRLRITADFSHWFCVHESDLRDQEDNLAAAIAATDHIHARVGFPEGPQVGDPRNPAHAIWLERHVALWRRIVAARRAEGRAFLTITPEWGPPPYMPLSGVDETPVADAWEVNCWMRNHLQIALAEATEHV